MVTHAKSLEDLGVVLEPMLIIKSLFFLWHIFWHGIADRKGVLDVMTEFQGFDTFFWTMKMSFLSFKKLETSSYVSLSFFFSHLFFISWRLITLQYCSGFCHTLTRISHGFTLFPIPIPPPTSLSTRSLWVSPVHKARALVSCIQPGLMICFTVDNMYVLMLFSRNIPPSPSPTESKSLFCTSVSLFVFCV